MSEYRDIVLNIEASSSEELTKKIEAELVGRSCIQFSTRVETQHDGRIVHHAAMIVTDHRQRLQEG